jgi:hypothetical protein
MFHNLQDHKQTLTDFWQFLFESCFAIVFREEKLDLLILSLQKILRTVVRPKWRKVLAGDISRLCS